MAVITIGDCSYPTNNRRRFVSDSDGRKPLYVQSVAALRNLAETNGPDMAVRAAAEALWESALDAYRKNRGLRRKQGTICLNLLFRKRCPACQGYADVQMPMPCHPPGSDHASMWSENGKPVVYVYQPYSLGHETLAELVKMCEDHGLESMITSWGAWHFPGCVLLVEIARKGYRFPRPRG